MVQKKKVLLNGKTYECECICKDETNYIKMRSLQQAGFMIGYDPIRKLLSVTVQELADLEEQTIEYLLRYQSVR